MKRIRVIILLLSIMASFSIVSTGHGQTYPDWRHDFLNLDLRDQTADSDVSNDQFLNQYKKIYRGFLKSLVNQTIKNYNDLSSQIDQLQNLAKSNKKLLNGDFDKMSYLTGALIFRAVSAGQFGKYVDSAKDLYSAYKYYKDLLEIQPNHHLTKTYGGIMAILYGELPNEYYNWLALLGIRMDSNDGYRQLKEVFEDKKGDEDSEYIESALILIIALKEFNDNKQAAWSFIENNGLEKHENILIQYYCSLAAFKAGYANRAIEILENQISLGGADKLPYIYYQIGRFKLYSGDPSSIKSLEKFLTVNSGDNYLKSAWQKMGWYYLMNEQSDMVEECFDEVKSRGADLVSADQQALREIENEALPQKDILWLRLLFDGGFYKECLAECKSIEKDKGKRLDNRQMVEILYRQARSHQNLKHQLEALKYYRKIVEDYPDVPTYQVPRAALKAGKLLAEMGKDDEAGLFYSRSLKLNKYGYQATIRREAHSARRELGK